MFIFFFQAEDGIRDYKVTGVQTCALPIFRYNDVIRQADEVLKSSHRNAQKNPAGFKEFEIALRKQLRKLADLKLSYPVDQQEKISQAITSAELAKEAMFQAIFGTENIRHGKGKGENLKKEAP